MIRQIIDNINSKVDYSFKDVFYGVVYPIYNKDMYIPGSRSGEIYKDAVPDSSKKSIVYWEDWGTTTLESTKRWQSMQTEMRLIAWFNFSKIDKGYDECVNELLSVVPRKEGKHTRLFLQGMLPKTEDIFARYNYREGKQYMTAPFDVVALRYQVRYMNLPYCPI